MQQDDRGYGYRALEKKLENLWRKGSVCRALLTPEQYADQPFLRFKIPCPVPKEEFNQRLPEIFIWMDFWRAKAIEREDCCLVEISIKHKLMGNQDLPSHFIIQTPAAALPLLGRENEAKNFLSICAFVKNELPQLYPWIIDHPLFASKDVTIWPGIVAVAQYFLTHPRCNLYVRQLDIRGIDTKFIERNRHLMKQVLDYLLPEDFLDDSTNDFYQRFGLKKEPASVEVRILDETYALNNGLMQFSTSVTELAKIDFGIRNVFITENKMNGLAFPLKDNSMILFGKGYGMVDIVRNLPWLKTKKIYYWGDIDTYGFDILSKIRFEVPQTESFLMDINTLNKYQRAKMSGIEKVQCLIKPPFLTQEEAFVWREISIGKIRLEQERIGYRDIEIALEAISISDTK
jgi:hypothetical protein